jgi:DNA-binding MarR family transcriptional regulator
MTDFNAEDVARLRTALGRISRLIDRQVSNGGMTRTQLSVLGLIARRGPIGASEVAEVEGVNPTMLSRILSKLVDAGLVVRASGPDDRRAVLVQVTDAGAEVHDRLRAERAHLLAERLGRLPAGEARRLLAALPALEGLAEEMAREPVRR